MRGKPVAIPRARHLIAADSAHSAGFGGVYRAESGDSVTIEMDGNILAAHWIDHFRAALLPESSQDYFSPQFNGMARFREVNGKMELVIEDGLGSMVLRAKRE